MIATATLPLGIVECIRPAPTRPLEATDAGVCYWLSSPNSRQSISASRLSLHGPTSTLRPIIRTRLATVIAVYVRRSSRGQLTSEDDIRNLRLQRRPQSGNDTGCIPAERENQVRQASFVVLFQLQRAFTAIYQPSFQAPPTPTHARCIVSDRNRAIS